MSDLYKTDISFKDDLVVTPTGDLDLSSGLGNLKESLFRRLLTTPGTLMHRPEYGVGIKDFQNSLSTISNQTRLAQVIKRQFELDSRVESVLGISVKVDNLMADLVQINVRVKPVGYAETMMSFIPFGDV